MTGSAYFIIQFNSQDEKKKFDRASQSYYASLEKHLGTSSKRKEAVLNEVSPTEQWRVVGKQVCVGVCRQTHGKGWVVKPCCVSRPIFNGQCFCL